MTDGILWCPHCRQPHRLGTRACPTTGRALEASVNRVHERGAVPPKRQHALIGTVIDGKYRVTKKIGAGGRGEVFEAEQLVLRRPVAIKIAAGEADAEAAERMRREAYAVARISHPHICGIFDAGTMPDGSPYLALERLHGETLSERMRRKRKLSPPLVVELFTQVLSGLHAAHGAGILHRDLKPHNVFLVERAGDSPVVKILDFGFAMDVSGEVLRRITKPGKACGTPQYMSPEQLTVMPLDARSDIFSIGIMMYEALTGVHPFTAPSIVEIGARIMRETPASVRSLRASVTPALAAVVERALAKNPRDRFANASVMQAALASCLDVDEPEPESTTAMNVIPHLSPASSSPTSGAF